MTLTMPLPSTAAKMPERQFSRSSASRRRASGGKSSGTDSSITGSLILYFSLAQLPKSVSLHRSLQKGKSGDDSESVG
jgi:hypothetical protein